jgi:Ca-activated chloride channel family protein
MLASADNYIRIKLKKMSSSAVRRDKLLSLTKDLRREDQKEWYTGNETYASLIRKSFC